MLADSPNVRSNKGASDNDQPTWVYDDGRSMSPGKWQVVLANKMHFLSGPYGIRLVLRKSVGMLHWSSRDQIGYVLGFTPG